MGENNQTLKADDYLTINSASYKFYQYIHVLLISSDLK